MTVDTPVSLVEALGDASAVEFSYAPIEIFEASQLSVWHVDAAGLQTLLVQGSGSTNYELFPTTFPVGGSTGYIVYPADRSTPMPVGEKLIMKRLLPGTQDLDLVNQGAYFPDTLERALDSNLMNTLQATETVSRAVRVQVGDKGVDTELPTTVGAAGAYMRLNDAEDGLVWSVLATTSGSASDTTPQQVEYDQAGEAGVSPDYSRSDHVHSLADDPYTENVRNFGATGDGVTDDRAAIESADTAAVSSGKPIYFPPGAYRVASDLTIASNIVFEPGAQITLDSGVTLTSQGQISGSQRYIFKLFGVGVSFVKLNHKFNSVVSPLWFGDTVDEVTIQHAISTVEVTDDVQSGGVVELPAGFHRIDTSAGPLTISGGLTMRGPGAGPGPGAGESGGAVLRNVHQANDVIYVNTDTFVHLHDFGIDAPGITKNSGTAGIKLDDPLVTNSTTQKIVERVRILHMYHGIHVLSAFAPRIRDCRIFNFTYIGILLEQDTQADTDVGIVEGCYLWDISGTSGAHAGIDWRNGACRMLANRILGRFTYGIALLFSNETTNSGPVIIHGNMIERQVSYCLRAWRSSGATTAGTIIGHLLIQGNHFQGIDLGFVTHLLISGSTPNWVNALSIEGNVFQNTLSTLSGNSIISVNAGDNVVVANNLLQNETGGDGGISTSGTTINCLITDNVITGGTTALKYPLLNGGTIVKDNTGITFADLPAGVGNGSQMYVSDGTAGTPMTGAGTGSLGIRLASAWKGL